MGQSAWYESAHLVCLNKKLTDLPVHHTDAHLADAVAHILTDLGPSFTADSLAEQLKRIQTACSEAAASASQPEQPISQDTINTINNLLPPSSRDVPLQDKAPLLRLVQKASLRALDVLAEQKAQYLRNMRIFHQELQKQLSELHLDHDSMDTVAAIIGDGVLQTSNKLWFLVGELPEERVQEKYLVEIQRYWRRFGGKEAASGFEDGWVYLADCPLNWEY